MKPKFKFALFLQVFCLIGCNFHEEKVTYDSIPEDLVIEEEHDYEEVLDYQLLLETVFDVDSSRYYVYFYSLSCSHCNQIKNYMIKKALERQDIYFVKGTSKDQLTNDSKKLIGAENPGDIWITGYPSLLLISNQKCTKNLAGETQIKNELK